MDRELDAGAESLLWEKLFRLTHPKGQMKQPVVARSHRAGPLLICKKCLGRCSAGGRIWDRVKRRVKRRSPEKKQMPRLVPVNCFGICPRGSAVLASAGCLRDNEYVLVSRPRQVEATLERLLPPA